jgi:hypothetical protein
MEQFQIISKAIRQMIKVFNHKRNDFVATVLVQNSKILQTHFNVLIRKRNEVNLLCVISSPEQKLLFQFFNHLYLLK